jgi:hypothetical protein
MAITGMLAVAVFAAWTAGGPAATIAFTRSLTNSTANPGKRDTSPSASRRIRSVPKSLDGLFKPSLIAATRASRAAACPGCSTPILRVFNSCPCAATGHAAAPASPAMNSRRFIIRSPRRRAQAVLAGYLEREPLLF